MAPWRLRLLVQRTAGGFAGAGGTRLAAAIAYYALLSVFPLVIALVAGANLVLGVERARDDVVDEIVAGVPLTGEGSDDLRRILLDAGRAAGTVGALSLLGLLWTASGMMGAIRTGLTAVTGGDEPRPFLAGKAVDVLMVLLTGVLFLCSTALTVATRVAEERLAALGLPSAAGVVAGVAAPILLAFGTLVALLRFVPAHPIAWSGVWRGAAGGAAALWVLATGFAIYVGNFGRYNAVYGSLGAVAAVLVFVFLAAVVLLLTAAAAACWDDVRAARRPPEPDPYGRPAGERVRRALVGLVVRR